MKPIVLMKSNDFMVNITIDEFRKHINDAYESGWCDGRNRQICCNGNNDSYADGYNQGYHDGQQSGHYPMMPGYDYRYRNGGNW